MTAALLRAFPCNSLPSPRALQPRRLPRRPRGGFLAFVVLASLHGVLRRVARSWRSPSWHLRRGLLPVALTALALVNFSSSFPLVDDKRQRDRIRLWIIT